MMSSLPSRTAFIAVLPQATIPSGFVALSSIEYPLGCLSSGTFLHLSLPLKSAAYLGRQTAETQQKCVLEEDSIAVRGPWPTMSARQSETGAQPVGSRRTWPSAVAFTKS